MYLSLMYMGDLKLLIFIFSVVQGILHSGISCEDENSITFWSSVFITFISTIVLQASMFVLLNALMKKSACGIQQSFWLFSMRFFSSWSLVYISTHFTLTSSSTKQLSSRLRIFFRILLMPIVYSYPGLKDIDSESNVQ